MSWIMTSSGKHYSLDNPQVDQVSLVDIAHHLSQICRYTGACKWLFSVAQHCLLGAAKMSEDGLSARLQLLFMLHDAPEAYYTDVNKPLKTLLGDVYDRLETQGMKVIWDAFLIEHPTDEEWEIVMQYDKYMFQNEISVLMPNPQEFGVEVLNEVQIERESIEDIENLYTQVVFELVVETMLQKEMRDAV